MSARRVGRARRARRDRRWWHCGLLVWAATWYHRPNQEPTSSVLREAHTRPSRVLKHSLKLLGGRRAASLWSAGAFGASVGCQGIPLPPGEKRRARRPLSPSGADQRPAPV